MPRRSGPKFSQRRGFSLRNRRQRMPCNCIRVVIVILSLSILAVVFYTYMAIHKQPEGKVRDIMNVDPPLTPIAREKDFEGNKNSTPLPKWVKEYIAWHTEMRSKFPGKEIIEHPDAPPVLVRTCLGICGGLHDRLGQLPFDLYLASQAKRILLIKWIKPQPLEEFLIPPTDGSGIDWVFPKDVKGWGTSCKTLNECAKQVRAQPQLMNNVGGDRGNKESSIEILLSNGIHSLTEGDLKDEKAVTFTIMAHLEEDVLEKRLRQMGETDMIHQTGTFGNIFRTFFQPHPNVQSQIDAVQKEYGLVPRQYSIAHTRVRHPKAYPSGEKFSGEYIANADKTGLPFVGRFKELAVGIASRAIECATMADKDAINQPIYFMSDSSDLVDYMTCDLLNSTYISQHPDWFTVDDGTFNVNVTARDIMQKHNVVARKQDFPNAHIDKNKGRKPPEYYATFVDLWLGMNARCVSFGIGKYAIFAAKLSGTKCKIRYAREVWGETETDAENDASTCNLPQYPSASL